jgi:cellobiose epimerase
MDNHTQSQPIAYLRASAEQWQADILHYWMTQTVDDVHGGFVGAIDGHNIVMPDAVKGAVLNCRILYTFAAAYRHTGQAVYLDLAKRAYQYICNHFVDQVFGGVYWSVTQKGVPYQTKKQVYAQAFWIYGAAEYFACTGDATALEHCKTTYALLEAHALDETFGGYFEAFDEEWKPIGDMRLSQKDANSCKSMNTHLHVLEAYTSLFSIWPQASVRKSIEHLLEMFSKHIVNHQTGHLHLFFEENWQVQQSNLISYGHDIEAGWLLLEAAACIQEFNWIAAMRNMAIKLTDAALEGIDAADGGLWYESEQEHWVFEKHWWPQAEAIVGCLNAWQINGNPNYLQTAVGLAQFIDRFIVDGQLGEWHWGVNKEGQPMVNFDKAGFWKCPYHNARCCFEISKRLPSFLQQAALHIS